MFALSCACSTCPAKRSTVGEEVQDQVEPQMLLASRSDLAAPVQLGPLQRGQRTDSQSCTPVVEHGRLLPSI